MRKIVTSNLVSLDGNLASPGGGSELDIVNEYRFIINPVILGSETFQFTGIKPEANGINKCKTVKHRRSNALLSTQKINFKY